MQYSSKALHTFYLINSLADSNRYRQIVMCKQTRETFCEINRTRLRSRGFLIFVKTASLQSNAIAERQVPRVKSEPPEYFPRVRLHSFLGRNFHISKSQKKFWPADRNSKLAKPNMYFTVALITFAAKTPTANEKRPTKSTKNAQDSYAHTLFRLYATLLYLFLVFFSQKSEFTCARVDRYVACVLRSSKGKLEREGWFALFNCQD